MTDEIFGPALPIKSCDQSEEIIDYMHDCDRLLVSAALGATPRSRSAFSRERRLVA
jgi:acyl-CoA reductase-like NAD-dependent aldehyde dehydrogenase